MFLIFMGLLNAIVGLSVHGASARRYFDKNISKERLAIYNGNCLVILLATFIVSLLLVKLFGNVISSLLSISEVWLYYATFCVFFSFLLTFRLVQWQVRENAYKYGFTQILNSFITFILTVMFVVHFEAGADGRVFALLITSFLLGLLSVFSLYRSDLVSFSLKKEDIKDAVRFGAPLIPHVCGGFLLMSFDRYIINQELGLAYAGMYMVLVNLGNAINMLFNSMNRAYTPWLFSRLKKDDLSTNKIIVKYTYIFFLLLIIFSIINFKISDVVYELFTGADYHSVSHLLPVVIQGQIFFGMYLVVTNYLFYMRKTKYVSLVTILSGFINVVLVFAFIKDLGLQGVAYAFLISSAFRFVLTWALSAKFYSMPWLNFYNFGNMK